MHETEAKERPMNLDQILQDDDETPSYVKTLKDNISINQNKFAMISECVINYIDLQKVKLINVI